MNLLTTIVYYAAIAVVMFGPPSAMLWLIRKDIRRQQRWDRVTGHDREVLR